MPRRKRGVGGVLLASTAALVTLAVAAGGQLAATGTGEELAGGATTAFDDGRNAFSHPAANLSADRQTAFFIGNSFFKRNWVEAPASTTGRDGLGPHFIARSCAACHALDGRGAPPATKGGVNVEAPVALLARLSLPGDGGKIGVVPEPTYGTQLNNAAITGIKPEGRIRIRYREIGGRFADGEPYRLRKPEYAIDRLGYGALDPRTRISPRIAPQIVGMGLLEAIRADDIRANAQRQAVASDGISGRVNLVWDGFAKDWVIGRFGWKANVGSVAHQVASAFNGDIGLTSAAFPNEECSARQTDCVQRQRQEAAWRNERAEGPFDVDDRTLERTIFYGSTIAVPARRDVRAPEVSRGQNVFNDIGCAACHRPSYVTGDSTALPELARQKIYPYTDLLLHDMGEGLADGATDFAAGEREWRTPPLWGIGLINTVNDHTFFLHDGRARSLMEAVLWHGGEAEAARERVLRLSKAERTALIRFLESL